jgi:hypothetical protein
VIYGINLIGHEKEVNSSSHKMSTRVKSFAVNDLFITNKKLSSEIINAFKHNMITIVRCKMRGIKVQENKINLKVN